MNDAPRSTPKTDLAIEYLRDYLKRHKLKPGTLLPSHYALADAAGICHVTMLRAMRRLADEGALTLTQRKRAGVPLQPGVAPVSSITCDPLPVQTAWREARDALARDILKGDYRHHTALPPFKQLSNRYGVSQPTLRKTLNSLVRENLLERHGRGYRVAARSMGRSNASIALIGYGSDATLQLGSHDDALIASLQRDAVRSNWELLVVTFNRESGGVRCVMQGGLPVNLAQLAVLGYIYVYSQQSGLDEEILTILGSTRKPVAFFDEVGDERVDHLTSSYPQIRLFRSLVSAEPARTVARYLLDRGRTRVAFVASRAAYASSENRLAGLIDEFRTAGCSETIYRCTENLHHELDQMSTAIRKEHETHQRALQKLLSPTFTGFIKQCLNDSILRRYLENAYLIKRVMSDVHRAIEAHQVNAIVTVGDSLIPHVVNLCRQLNRKIPGDIAVVSFDDLQESRTYRVPSYNFDIAALAYLMAFSILWPNKFAEFHKQKVIDLPGYLVIRGALR